MASSTEILIGLADGECLQCGAAIAGGWFCRSCGDHYGAKGEARKPSLRAVKENLRERER